MLEMRGGVGCGRGRECGTEGEGETAEGEAADSANGVEEKLVGRLSSPRSIEREERLEGGHGGSWQSPLFPRHQTGLLQVTALCS